MYKIRYNVNKKGVLVKIAAALMMLSVIFRMIGYWGFWKNQSAWFNYSQILLPVVCCILYILVLLCWGEKHFTWTLVPVLMGVVFFIIKSTDMKLIAMLACMVMSLIFAIVYTVTLMGGLETKWALAAVTGVPLVYQLIVRDGATLLAREDAMSMSEFIPELSVLCILAALFTVTFAMKKYVPEDPDAIIGDVVGEEDKPKAEAAEEKAAEEKLPELTESVPEAAQEETKE